MEKYQRVTEQDKKLRRKKTDKKCTDNSVHCEQWGQSKFCGDDKYKPYMEKYCRETCQICQ